MLLEKFVTVDGKRLRCGYTTGSCAAAAAQAAAWILLTGEEVSVSRLTTPSGVRLELPVEEIRRSPGRVCCGVRKDAGDDPDVTHGAVIFADVEVKSRGGEEIRVLLDGGEGVGRVTLPGLEQPVGAAAINRVPREMIRQGVTAAAKKAGFQGTLSVTVSVPGGEKLAQRTFNPRLGIRGGISILGTSGIVKPMSQAALTATVRAELQVLAAAGERGVVLTPGNYGRDFLRETSAIPDRLAVQYSNFLGEALDDALELGFCRILVAGHLGKLVKLAGGIMNTHSRQGDCRMELITAHAALAGVDRGTARRLMQAATTPAALDILEEAGLLEPVLRSLGERMAEVLRRRTGEEIQTGVLVFTQERGTVILAGEAPELLREFSQGAAPEGREKDGSASGLSAP